MSGGHPKSTWHAARVICSWTLFLLVSLGAMLASLAAMAAAGPAGVADRAAAAATQAQAQTQTQQALEVGHTTGATIGTPPKVTAPTAFLFDANTDQIYYAKDADKELPMASCTKIMTLLLAVEHGNLSQMVTIGADAAALVRADSSYMGVSVGEQISMNDLLYGLVLPSGNDAAIAIADAVAGNVPNFIALMNARAKQLGLTHTHFVTPNGLDLVPDGHYTSARDLSVLAGVAMKNPTIVKVTSTLQYHMPKTATHKAYSFVTGIDLLPGARSPYVGAIGVKPGYTGLAGFCEAFAAVRHGHLIVGTVLDEPSWQVRIVDMRALLDYGFAQYGIPPAPVVPSWTIPPPDK